MTAAELRASFSLAGIYGLRMLGLFIILPIFALYAEKLPGGQSHFLIGIALEEHDLIAMFGDEYRRYRQRVAMIVPFIGRSS